MFEEDDRHEARAAREQAQIRDYQWEQEQLRKLEEERLENIQRRRRFAAKREEEAKEHPKK